MSFEIIAGLVVVILGAIAGAFGRPQPKGNVAVVMLPRVA